MKGWLCSVFCVAMMLGLAGAGCAQVMSPEELGLDYSLTIGAAFSVNQDVDNGTSPMVGIAWYGPASEVFGNNGAFGLSGDWIPIKTNAGNEVQLVPVMFNYKRYGSVGPYRIFTNLGIGILAATDYIPEMQIDSGANFGWTGGFGVDLTNQLFGQFRFIGGSEPGSDGLVTAQLGYRF